MMENCGFYGVEMFTRLQSFLHLVQLSIQVYKKPSLDKTK